MKNIIILMAAIAIGIYHIKNTDYALTVYLVQILIAVLAYNVVHRIKRRIEARRDD